MYWIGFDVGGTFVDLFALEIEKGEFFALKVPSSRRSLHSAISSGLTRLMREAGIRADDVGRICHGTTVVTNQLIERRGARVGVITTAGFRDVLQIGRMRRPSLYDLFRDPVPPLADRDLRLEVHERIASSGAVRTSIDRSEASSVIEELKRRGAEVIAICLLNSYANPKHEEILEQLCLEAGVECSLSSVIAPEYGEYERWTTACVNSYVMPETASYMKQLSGVVANHRIQRPLDIMQSNGGVVSVDIGARFPARLIESGPAAGVAGAIAMATQAGYRDVITMDMGGTSTDIGIVVDGKPLDTSEYTVGDYPLQVIGVDIRSIGAGGGSIARIDRMGTLQVGPESAGAEPGPACYNRGGIQPTVTDADVVLGYLDPSRFCGGEIPLDISSSRSAIGRQLAERVGVTEEEAALGIVRIATVNMAGAIRQITAERGLDPRDFVLIAFGGAGPVHAALVATELEIEHVIVPNEPGLLSAKGLVLADYRTDAYGTFVTRLADVDPPALTDALQELERNCMKQLATAGDQVETIETKRYLEMCFEGQQYVIAVQIGTSAPSRMELDDASRKLDESFEEIHNFLPPGRVPQILRLRITALGRVGRKAMRVHRSEPAPPRSMKAEDHRRAYFDMGGPYQIRLPVHDRSSLVPNREVAGPCIIQETYSTTVVYPGYVARADEEGHLHLTAGLIV